MRRTEKVTRRNYCHNSSHTCSRLPIASKILALQHTNTQQTTTPTRCRSAPAALSPLYVNIRHGTKSWCHSAALLTMSPLQVPGSWDCVRCPLSLVFPLLWAKGRHQKIGMGGVAFALRWPPFNTLHTTINLKSALVVEGKMVRKRSQVRTCGGDIHSTFVAANGVMGKLREGGCASALDGHVSME